jgi:predicted O-methyltransferase YrrM
MPKDRRTPSEDYIIQLFAHEDESLIRVRERLVADQKIGINVNAAEGQLLKFLVGLVRPQLIVEIGTLYGYSTLWMAQALPEGGRILALEQNKDHFEKARRHFAESPYAHKIEIRCGDAREIIKTLDEKPDFIFIDADKGGYRHYLDWAMKAVRVGGVIVGDNTFLFGHMTGEDRGQKTSALAIESMRYFNTTLAQSPNFRAAMIPTHEGLTVAQKIKEES